MPIDMKEMIARAAAELMMDGNARKLTVTDIVDKCQITRQTFYYHFDGIPQMIEWIFQKRLDQLIDETWTRDDPEAGIRSFFIMALNAAPYIYRSMQSNYRDELERLMAKGMYGLFDRLSEQSGLYGDCTRSEFAIIRRYHCQAVIGILREWSARDTENLDGIVHTVYRLLRGDIRP